MEAVGDGRLEDVKEHLQNGVDVNEEWVSNYIYAYFTLIHYLIIGLGGIGKNHS